MHVGSYVFNYITFKSFYIAYLLRLFYSAFTLFILLSPMSLRFFIFILSQIGYVPVKLCEWGWKSAYYACAANILGPGGHTYLLNFPFEELVRIAFEESVIQQTSRELLENLRLHSAARRS